MANAPKDKRVRGSFETRNLRRRSRQALDALEGNQTPASLATDFDACPCDTGHVVQTRRNFLRGAGLGLGGVALATLLEEELVASSNQFLNRQPHFAPKAKNVIWLFMIGGTSHLESFDPKPALNKYAGKAIAATPYGDVLESPYLENERVVAFDPNNGFVRKVCYPLQVGYRQRGESGLEISDWWPHVGDCADELLFDPLDVD